MRITERQLLQIIKEELTRGISEADVTSAGVVATPSAPKKRGLFGPRETPADEAAWNAEWTLLSQGEKDAFVAGVKNDPSFSTVVGVAVKNKDFRIMRFMDIIQMPYPMGGSRVLEALVGSAEARGMSLARAHRIFVGFFTDNAERERELGYPMSSLGRVVARGEGTRLDRLVFDNARLVAALERWAMEGLFHDEYRGGLMPLRPSEAPHMAKFVDAALGI